MVAAMLRNGHAKKFSDAPLGHAPFCGATGAAPAAAGLPPANLLRRPSGTKGQASATILRRSDRCQSNGKNLAARMVLTVARTAPALTLCRARTYLSPMKTVTITLEDNLYHAASAEAARRRKPLGEFLQDLFLSALRTGDKAALDDSSATLQSLWELADAHPVTFGTASPLNRDDLYERGLSGH